MHIFAYSDIFGFKGHVFLIHERTFDDFLVHQSPCFCYHYIYYVRETMTVILLCTERALSPVRGAANHLGEGQPEFGAEHGVDDGVEGGVEVAQPQEEAGNVLVDDAALAQGHDQGHDEERQPAHDERAGDDGQRLGGFPLALRLQRLLFLALRFDAGGRGHAHPVHVHLDHRVPATTTTVATTAAATTRRRVRHGGPVVFDHRRLQLVMVLVLVLVVLVMSHGRGGAVVVVRGDRERGGLVLLAAAPAAAAAAASAPVSRFRLATSAAAVLRRLGHGTAGMTVDQPDARAHGRLFHLFLLLDAQEHGLPEETALLGLGGRFVRRYLFQPETRASKPHGILRVQTPHHTRGSDPTRLTWCVHCLSLLSATYPPTL